MTFNPWEADLDIDEETGEVELPPGYTGRRRGGVGQPPNVTTTQVLRQGASATPNAPGGATPTRDAAGPADGTLAPAPSNQAPCPPCPPCGPGSGRLRSPEGFPLGLIIGLGLVGGSLWWSGKMLADVAGDDELDGADVDAILASLPGSAPKMLAADIIEGEVVGEHEEG